MKYHVTVVTDVGIKVNCLPSRCIVDLTYTWTSFSFITLLELANLSRIVSLLIRDIKSCSDAMIINAFIQSSDMDDRKRFFMIRSLLKALSAEQLVTVSVTSTVVGDVDNQ